MEVLHRRRHTRKEGGGVSPPPPAPGDGIAQLFSFDFNSAASSPKTGQAVYGKASSDSWNLWRTGASETPPATVVDNLGSSADAVTAAYQDANHLGTGTTGTTAFDDVFQGNGRNTTNDVGLDFGNLPATTTMLVVAYLKETPGTSITLSIPTGSGTIVDGATKTLPGGEEEVWYQNGNYVVWQIDGLSTAATVRLVLSQAGALDAAIAAVQIVRLADDIDPDDGNPYDIILEWVFNETTNTNYYRGTNLVPKYPDAYSGRLLNHVNSNASGVNSPITDVLGHHRKTIEFARGCVGRKVEHATTGEDELLCNGDCTFSAWLYVPLASSIHNSDRVLMHLVATIGGQDLSLWEFGWEASPFWQFYFGVAEDVTNNPLAKVRLNNDGQWSPSTNMPTDDWFFLQWGRTGNQLWVRFNKGARSSITPANTLLDQTTVAGDFLFRIGAKGNNSEADSVAAAGLDRFWRGRIDEFRKYNRSLLDSELDAIHDATSSGLTVNLPSIPDVEEGSGQNYIDVTLPYVQMIPSPVGLLTNPPEMSHNASAGSTKFTPLRSAFDPTGPGTYAEATTPAGGVYPIIGVGYRFPIPVDITRIRITTGTGSDNLSYVRLEKLLNGYWSMVDYWSPLVSGGTLTKTREYAGGGPVNDWRIIIQPGYSKTVRIYNCQMYAVAPMQQTSPRGVGELAFGRNLQSGDSAEWSSVVLANKQISLIPFEAEVPNRSVNTTGTIHMAFVNPRTQRTRFVYKQFNIIHKENAPEFDYPFSPPTSDHPRFGRGNVTSGWLNETTGDYTGIQNGDIADHFTGRSNYGDAMIPKLNPLLGHTYKITAVATDSDLPRDTITYSLKATDNVAGTKIPTGMTISASGVIRWTPNQYQCGLYFFTVVASDGVSSVERNFWVELTYWVIAKSLFDTPNWLTDSGGNPIRLIDGAYICSQFDGGHKRMLADPEWTQCGATGVAVGQMETQTIPPAATRHYAQYCKWTQGNWVAGGTSQSSYMFRMHSESRKATWMQNPVTSARGRGELNHSFPQTGTLHNGDGKPTDDNRKVGGWITASAHYNGQTTIPAATLAQPEPAEGSYNTLSNYTIQLGPNVTSPAWPIFRFTRASGFWTKQTPVAGSWDAGIYGLPNLSKQDIGEFLHQRELLSGSLNDRGTAVRQGLLVMTLRDLEETLDDETLAQVKQIIWSDYALPQADKVVDWINANTMTSPATVVRSGSEGDYGNAGLLMDPAATTTNYFRSTITGIQNVATNIVCIDVIAPTNASAAATGFGTLFGLGDNNDGQLLTYGRDVGGSTTFAIHTLLDTNYLSTTLLTWGAAELMVVAVRMGSAGTKLWKNENEVTLDGAAVITTGTDTSPDAIGIADDEVRCGHHDNNGDVFEFDGTHFQRIILENVTDAEVVATINSLKAIWNI